MSDIVYRPIDNEPAAPATTSMPIESWSKFKDDFEEAVGASHDELTPEAATKERVRRREETPTAENASERPIVVHKSSGTGPKTLKQASDDLSFSRGLAKRDQLLADGFTEQEVQQLGLEKIEAAQRGDPVDPPPVEVKIADPFGEEGKPLTAEEAANRITNWRKEQEAQRRAELAEFTSEREQRQQVVERLQEYEAQPEQPPQPDPVAQEREQVVQERQRVEAIKQLSWNEVAGLNSLSQLSLQVRQAFPELANVRTEHDLRILHNNLQATNPARAQALVQADQMVRQKQTALAYLTTQRKAQEAQQAAAREQQRAQKASQHDAHFEARASKLVPNWEQQRTAVQAAAKQTLINAGISEAEQHELWHNGKRVDIRSVAAQELILKAALWDSAQAKARTIRESNLPRVIKPGVGAPRASAGMERVAELQRQLKTAKGKASIRIGTELMQARRALRNG